MEVKKIKAIVKKMTLEEKVSICSGSDFWHTTAIERLGVPAVMVSDGPHGLRKQDLEADHLGINNSIKAVCFPTGVALASSFDTELVYKVGQAIGNECQAENVACILGPANNIKRSPLCGRNFEYLSEDPYLSGKIAAAHINGVQSQGVGTSLKHFCANNQEFRRNSYDSRVEERAFREIYLKAFEIAVKESKPWTLMCAYNMINGIQASENKRILTDILRDEWGFEGIVMSDWGAVKDRAKGIAAGLDLEMPCSYGANDQVVIDAINDGSLDEKDLDKCVERILDFVFKSVENHKSEAIFDREKDHILARDVAKECMVLLKNDNNVLPLESTDYVLFVGGFVDAPRFQGGGSSHINSYKIDTMRYATMGNYKVMFEEGFSSKDDVYDEKLYNRALEAAKDADKVVVFAGLPDSFESEGYDREHMNLPEVQNRFIEDITKVCPHVVVVLENGSPVDMPWCDKVEGILETYLAGEGVGVATVQVLYGNANPSGRLAETFPLRVEDNPSYLEFGGDSNVIEYREGLYVGYRYYTKKKMPVRFPFGYGLSYSDFEYGKLEIDKTSMKDNEKVTVSIDITNKSNIMGKEVVQVYVEPDIKDSAIRRPVRELRAFTKIAIEPGEKKTVTFELDKSAFAYYDTDICDWYTEPGDYKIEICKNADEVIGYKRINIVPKKAKKPVYTVNTIYKELIADKKAWKIAKPYFDKYLQMGALSDSGDDAAKEAFGGEDCASKFIQDTTLRNVVNMGTGSVSYEEMMELLEKLNK